MIHSNTWNRRDNSIGKHRTNSLAEDKRSNPGSPGNVGSESEAGSSCMTIEQSFEMANKRVSRVVNYNEFLKRAERASDFKGRRDHKLHPKSIDAAYVSISRNREQKSMHRCVNCWSRSRTGMVLTEFFYCILGGDLVRNWESVLRLHRALWQIRATTHHAFTLRGYCIIFECDGNNSLKIRVALLLTSSRARKKRNSSRSQRPNAV